MLTAYEKAPQVTRQRLYIETIEKVLAGSSKVLSEQDGSGNVTYLPLDKLLEGRASGVAAASGPARQGAEVADPDVYDAREAPDEAALARLRESSRMRGTR